MVLDGGSGSCGMEKGGRNWHHGMEREKGEQTCWLVKTLWRMALLGGRRAGIRWQLMKADSEGGPVG